MSPRMFDLPTGRSAPNATTEELKEENTRTINGGDSRNEKKEPEQEVSSFRRIFPQVLACTANNCILFDNGLVLSMPTIVLAALNTNNPTEELSLSDEEATWFASISLICQPLGSLFSGLVMEPIGRKRSMMLLNIPFFCAWSLLYFANSVSALYIAAAIMGFGVGCTEAPILTYVGEITEPKYRGILTSYAQMCGMLAYVVLYLVGYYTTWRNTALFCATVPIITFLAVSQVPETPMWLISRGRLQDAENALRWLRGWVSPGAVAHELNLMIAHHGSTKLEKPDAKSSFQSTEGLVETRMTLWERLWARVKDFMRPEMRRPLFLVILYFFFFYASGLQTVRPYMVGVFNKLHMNMDVNQAVVLVSVSGFIGNAFCMILVLKVGKKMLSLVSLGACSVCSILLAVSALGYLDNNWPLPLFLILAFFTGLGVAPIPWMLQSELYPFRGKCLAAGIAAACAYVIGFIATKSYLFLESQIQLYGVFILFGVLSIIGAVYLNTKMPETEGKSLAEIEEYFAKKTKPLSKSAEEHPTTYSTYM